MKNAAAEPEADDSASEHPEAKREKVVIAFGKAIPQEPKRRTNHGGEDGMYQQSPASVLLFAS